jgi:hypothetical protein
VSCQWQVPQTIPAAALAAAPGNTNTCSPKSSLIRESALQLLPRSGAQHPTRTAVTVVAAGSILLKRDQQITTTHLLSKLGVDGAAVIGTLAHLLGLKPEPFS